MSLRFGTKLALIFMALFLGGQAALYLVIYQTTNRNVEGQIADQLRASGRVLQRVLSERDAQFTQSVSLLSRDFGFRQAIATGDQPTVLSALANLEARSSLDTAVVVDLDGELLAHVGNVEQAYAGALLPESLREQTLDAGAISAIEQVGNRLFTVVIAPVLAPAPVGWIAFGTELDERAAAEIQRLSPIELDIAFVSSRMSAGWQLAAATDHEAELRALVAEGTLRASADQDGEVVRGDVAGEEHLIWRQSVGQLAGGGEVDVLLFYSLNVALGPYRDLAITLLGIAGAGFLALILGSVAVSRSVTKPLRRLASVADRIAKGDYEDMPPAPASRDEVATLSRSFASMVGAVREREDRILHQALHDPETGLPNRIGFERHLDSLVRKGKPFAVLVAGVADVSELRSTLNHQYTTELMADIGQRIKHVGNCQVTRLSTESFALCVSDPDRAGDVAASVINAFSVPLPVADVQVDVTIRIGYVRFPKDGEDTATLLRRASVALDLARHDPTRSAAFDPEKDSTAKERLSLMSALRHGIEHGEVTFAYQPKYDLRAGRVTAVEALVRWISPERGFIPPDDFIPMAEKTGDIRHLTRWGINEAAAQCAAWRKKGCMLTVSVNLSASDLMNPDLPAEALRAQKEYDLPTGALHFEVTESAIMQDMDRALEVLSGLFSMGFPMSIDDYGTGYSSLSYLKRLPVGELKIDKSFVLKLAQSEEDQILVRSTVDLAHNLGLKVTAEGVEDEASVDLLKRYGCDVIQGYHIARPMPADETLDFIMRSRVSAE